MTAKTIVRWYGKIFNSRIKRQLEAGDDTRLHKNHLLVSLVGRKSGKTYTFPVNYCVTPEGTYVISTEANWRHNFAQDIDVELLVAGEHISGLGTWITNDAEKRQRLGRMLTGRGWFFFSRSLTIIEITPNSTVQP